MCSVNHIGFSFTYLNKQKSYDLLLYSELQRKLASVEADNRSIREEFDVQRAKLKELFLQKEGTFWAYILLIQLTYRLNQIEIH